MNSKNDELITVADRSRRVLALAGFLTDITEWGWPEAPPRKLVFRDDNPKLPQVLPRYLPVDVDRRLTQALVEHPGNELAAAALRLQRSCGLRIGELLDLELDCVHELPGHGSWLKVPLGKLDTERMVPLDAEILDADRPHHRDPLPRPADAAPPLPAARPVPVHPPRPTAVAERGPRRTRPGRRAPPGSTTSPRTSCATPTPPPWSTPASRCRR